MSSKNINAQEVNSDPVHNIPVNYHKAHKAIENICLLGAQIKDPEAKDLLRKIDSFVQDIWSKSLDAQENSNRSQEVQKHTPGKLEIRRTSTGFALDTDTGDLIAMKSNPICEINLSPYSEANAARIVQCWNEYDELKAENEQLKAANKKAADLYLSVCTELSNQYVEIEQLKASNKELRDVLRKVKTIFYNMRNGLDKVREIDVQAFIDKALQKTK